MSVPSEKKSNFTVYRELFTDRVYRSSVPRHSRLALISKSNESAGGDMVGRVVVKRRLGEIYPCPPDVTDIAEARAYSQVSSPGLTGGR